MKISLESTDRIVMINRVEARVWEGKTASGIPVFACICIVSVPADQNPDEFQEDLVECSGPASQMANAAFPLEINVRGSAMSPSPSK